MDLKPDGRAMPAYFDTCSHDGYVRVSATQLASITLALLYAACDERVLSDAWDLGLPACHAGHCEWIDTNWRPPMTFGWAWLTDRDRTCRMFPNSVTSNVMIVCARGYDVGPDHTRSLLADWINTLPWTVSVRAHLALPVL
ncbi:DUF4902 domain-containing protein [Burkholderia ambifaria]|uniref:DUF4902 domain-containing protein n=1 Tax=Burkholderia ambifaria TaxID=152480 RepID=UPI00158A0AB3|nr:DUF4902 domain-containing protein [Burkholderia ambifaria]